MVIVRTTPTVAEIVTVPSSEESRKPSPTLVRISSAYSGHLLDWLQRGQLQLAVSYDPQPLRSLRILPVMMENFLLVSAGADRLSLNRAVPFANLAGEELVLPSPRHGLRVTVEDCARQAGVELYASVEASSGR